MSRAAIQLRRRSGGLAAKPWHAVRYLIARMSRWLQVSASVATFVALACSRSDTGARRTATIDDRRAIPAPRSQPSSGLDWWGSLGYVTRPTRAGAVTALDEVPDSTWFTNRNAAQRLSTAAIRNGPALHRTPRDGSKWVAIGMKQTGVALGLRARDDAGDEFFLKLDPAGHDEVETGADVVVQRLLFAAGYNVPENDVVYLRRSDVSVAHDGSTGDEPPLRDDEIDALLARAAREPDGRYRALASRIIPGKPIGGITSFGTRVDDPNDQLRHQDRRDMRGLYALAAWVNHTDIKPANTLDVWVADRRDPSRGHVVHYLLDFGKALGAMARIDGRLDAGFAYHEQPKLLLVKHAITGTQVPWAGIGPFPALPGLGWIESERFDPASWKPFYHWLPFEKADRFDKLWGARLVASFTPEQIRAALAAARYSDPRTVDYLARVLVVRQRKILAEFFRGVAPLERFEIRGTALCFVDLWTRHALGGPDAMYTAEIQTAAGGDAKRHAKPKRDGTVCFENVRREVPAVVEIEIARGGHVIAPTRVEITAPPGGPARVTAIGRR
jgi:hypothetical protein